MLNVTRRRSIPSSASPADRLGRSDAPERAPARARLFLGGFHSPFHLAHRLTGEWREWRDLLAFNDVDEPWKPEGSRDARFLFMDEEAQDMMPPEALPIEQPAVDTFPEWIRIAGEADPDENSLTVWAYDVHALRPPLAAGVRLDLESEGVVELRPIPVRMQAMQCVLFALGAGYVLDVSIQRDAWREFLICH